MALMLKLTIKFWWFLLAMIPVVLWRVVDQLYKEINCPRVGDCYNLGWWTTQNLESWAAGFACLIWPVCLWHLGGRWIVGQFTRKTAHSSFKQKTVSKYE